MDKFIQKIRYYYSYIDYLIFQMLYTIIQICRKDKNLVQLVQDVSWVTTCQVQTNVCTHKRYVIWQYFRIFILQIYLKQSN